MSKNTTPNKKARLTQDEIKEAIAMLDNVGDLDCQLDDARERIHKWIKAKLKASPYLEKPVLYGQLLPVLEKKWATDYAQKLLRDAGLYLRKSKGKGNDGRAKNGSTKGKPPVLRGKAKQAFVAIGKLKLTDKQIADLIANLIA